MIFWDIHLRTVGHFSGFMCVIRDHQCAINACNVRPTLVMVEKLQVWPDITVLAMGHYRRVYNGSRIVHNRFLDETQQHRTCVKLDRESTTANQGSQRVAEDWLLSHPPVWERYQRYLLRTCLRFLARALQYWVESCVMYSSPSGSRSISKIVLPFGFQHLKTYYVRYETHCTPACNVP